MPRRQRPQRPESDGRQAFQPPQLDLPKVDFDPTRVKLPQVAIIGFLIANLIAEKKSAEGGPPSGHKIEPERPVPEEVRPAPAEKTVPATPPEKTPAVQPEKKKGPVVEATVPAQPPTK